MYVCFVGCDSYALPSHYPILPVARQAPSLCPPMSLSVVRRGHAGEGASIALRATTPAQQGIEGGSNMDLRKTMQPSPSKLDGSAAGIDSNEQNLPGQSTPTPPGQDIDADIATLFPGKKSVPETTAPLSDFSRVVDAAATASRAFTMSKLPFFFCKISAKHLPRLDVFSASDPVCFVRELGSNTIVHRTEVIPDDSDPDFEKQLRLKPQIDSAQKNQANQAYMYDPQHVLSFSLYDSCRKDALASSKVLSDLDLEPLGSVNVSIAAMLRCIEMHEADPRTPLYVKFKLNRDEKQSMMTKTFEQLGSLHSKMNIFAQESKKAPKLVLHLTPIR